MTSPTASTVQPFERSEMRLKRKTTDLAYLHKSCRTFNTASEGQIISKLTLDPSIGLPSPPSSPNRILCPTPEVCSSASSTPASEDKWSPALTPKKSHGGSFHHLLTPITPLSTLSASLSAIKGTVGSDADSVPRLLEHDTTDPEEYFKPQKLFRHLTDQLEQISKFNATAANLKYELQSSHAFVDYCVRYSSAEKSAKSQVTVENQQSAVQYDTYVLRKESKTDTRRRTEFRTILEIIMPSDVQARLRADEFRCVGSYVKDAERRCQWNRPKTYSNLQDTIKKVSKYYMNDDDSAVVQCIQDLIARVMCGNHRNAALIQPMAPARIDLLYETVLSSPDQAYIELEEYNRWIETIISKPVQIDSGDPHHDFALLPRSGRNSLSREVRPKLQRTGSIGLVKALRNAQEFSFKDFQPYQPKRVWGLSISEALRHELQRPLTSDDCKSGYIYMFWDLQNFGYVKIGRTNNLEERLKRWNKQCGRNHVYHNNGEPIEIPHVQRVELLIHTELKEIRRRQKCHSCGTMHKEWFQANQTLAERVLKKWQAWILQRPYALDGKEWKVRPEILENLADFCQPIEAKGISSKSRRPSQARKARGKKKAPRWTV